MYGVFTVVVIFISRLWSSVKGPSASAEGSLDPGLSVCLILSLSCPVPVLPLASAALVALCPTPGNSGGSPGLLQCDGLPQSLLLTRVPKRQEGNMPPHPHQPTLSPEVNEGHVN